ncbi:MAG: cell division protein ZapA [Pseudomonadota bacterium]
MSRDANTFTVSILDKEYQVACPPEQQAELLLSAKHLDDQMRSIRSHGKVIGLERIAVMAALNISHELLQARSKLSSDADDCESSPSADKPKGATKAAKAADEGGAEEPKPSERSLSSLNAKLDQALHQLRQLEIS